MDQQLLLIAVVAIALSATLGLVLGRYAWPSRPIDLPALTELRANLSHRELECDAFRGQAETLRAERGRVEEQSREFSHQCAALAAEVKSLQQQIEHQSALLKNAETARADAADKAQKAAAQIATLSATEKHLAEKVETQTGQLAELQTKLTTEFENIATRILKANSSQLSETSNQSLSALLTPLHDKIKEFQKKVEDTYSSEQREVVSLREQIRIALDVSQSVGQKADDLAKALRGNSQRQGRWGELVLERLLEESGLRDGIEYTTQGRGLKLKSDEGGALRPDVIINLPEGRSLILDSKVPLAAYERLVLSDDDAERQTAREQFLRDVKGHIDDLAGKRYQDNAKLQAHEFAMLFMPIESSLYEAITADPGLFNYAWNKSVVLVGPSTLLATMRTVASIWRYEKQAENAQRIARDAGLLLDKISNSVDDLNRVGTKLAEATSAHNEAQKKLFSGKGNAVAIGERIRIAGVKAKPMTKPLVDGLPVASASYDDSGDSEASEPSSPDDPDFARSLLENRAFDAQPA